MLSKNVFAICCYIRKHNLIGSYMHMYLRSFALIVSSPPYCARKSTCHRARKYIKLNNDRADGHCYSFDWI